MAFRGSGWVTMILKVTVEFRAMEAGYDGVRSERRERVFAYMVRAWVLEGVPEISMHISLSVTISQPRKYTASPRWGLPKMCTSIFP